LLNAETPMTKSLTHEQARKFYDRFGEKQDAQGWYEDAALDCLRAHGAFNQVANVLEFGCGTGKLALQLFEEEFSPDTCYQGVDISAAMIAIAKNRLAPFAARADIRQTDGQPILDAPDRSIDRVIACYVIDLLSHEDAKTLIAEARRVLTSDGLLCVASLTRGASFGSRIVSTLWSGVHKVNPNLLGGCRPIEMSTFIDDRDWTILHQEVVTAAMIPSEVIVARPKAHRENRELG
jgi:ubiquinone/menaquinone biosynthesis C-methylase UbiE